MRISDWSSDVCSSDLVADAPARARLPSSWLARKGDRRHTDFITHPEWMPKMDRTDMVRKLFAAYLANRKDLAEQLLSADFTFSSPPDDHINMNAYFRDCWPQSPSFRDLR